MKIEYLSPELELRFLAEESVICTSDLFETEQNEAINENDYIW